MGYLIEMIKTVDEFTQKVKEINEKYKSKKLNKKAKSPTKILNILKEIEKKHYKDNMQFINECEDWKEFCEYATDNPNKEPFIYITEENNGYLILNIKDKVIEIVDFVCDNPFQIWELFSIIKKVIKKYDINDFEVLTIPKSFNFLKRLYCLDLIEIIYLKKEYDQDYLSDIYHVKFVVKNK